MVQIMHAGDSLLSHLITYIPGPAFPFGTVICCMIYGIETTRTLTTRYVVWVKACDDFLSKMITK